MRRRQGGTGLLQSVDDVLEASALGAADGVRLLGMGAPLHADEGCLCSAHAVVSALLEDLCGPERVVVVDMEASPKHLSRSTVRHVDLAWSPSRTTARSRPSAGGRTGRRAPGRTTRRRRQQGALTG